MPQKPTEQPQQPAENLPLDQVPPTLPTAEQRPETEQASVPAHISSDGGLLAGVSGDDTVKKGVFGNADTKKEFDLRQHLRISELPTDKVIVAFRHFHKMPSGQIVEDEASRNVQPMDPADYDAWTKPDKDSGLTLYDTMGNMKPTLLHDPRAN